MFLAAFYNRSATFAIGAVYRVEDQKYSASIEKGSGSLSYGLSVAP